jgi:hypothetical protein
MKLHRTRHRHRPPTPGRSADDWAGRNELADLRDDLRRQDPELAAAFAGFDARSLPLWARPLTWVIGSVVVVAAAVIAVLWAGFVVLGVLAFVLVLGALVLLSAGTPDGRRG